MAFDILLSVSKRLQKVAAAVLVLLTGQLVIALSGCGHPENVPMGAMARAPITGPR